jgi:hypothetical protein
MYRFARDEGIDLDEPGTQLRKMSHEELRVPRSLIWKLRQVFVIQLEEARAECKGVTQLSACSRKFSAKRFST